MPALGLISDACIGLAESAAEFFPEAAWQRCLVHWYRNVFSHVPSTKAGERDYAHGDPCRRGLVAARE
jgi:transposase-like protein